MKWTKEQQNVIDFRNRDILVSAAAGSGKTAVLVARIIQRILDPQNPVDIDRLLVVTFTKAAAAEMRERIGAAIEAECEKDPQNTHLRRQSALIHNAMITTIDSFCLFVVRNHFEEISLDPNFRIADEGEIRLLEQDVLRLPGALQNFSRIAGCGDMPAKEWRICAQLYELFAELDAARGPAQGHGGNYVGQAVNYIKSNYSQPMRVQDIAAGLGLNRSYFCRLFRQQTGLSPQEYIVSCRLAKAAQFMTEHGMSQEEAARQAGYPDVFSFSRMFRRKYGMPPGRYAARARQKQGG